MQLLIALHIFSILLSAFALVQQSSSSQCSDASACLGYQFCQFDAVNSTTSTENSTGLCANKFELGSMCTSNDQCISGLCETDSSMMNDTQSSMICVLDETTAQVGQAISQALLTTIIVSLVLSILGCLCVSGIIYMALKGTISCFYCCKK